MPKIKNGFTFPDDTSKIMDGTGEFVDKPSGTGLTAAEIVNLLYPIGRIIITTDATNPGTLFSVGTWAAFGAGRVLMGLKSDDTDFDTVEEIGGAKTKTLSVNEIPAHNHVQTVNSTASGGLSGYTADTSTNNGVASGYSTQNAGGGAAFSILPPYQVVYFWKRTA